MTKEFYALAEQLIKSLLDDFLDFLDLESVNAIEHYLNHGEYEMAFEGLFIELIKADVSISQNELNKYFELGKDLNLDRDSVFDDGFWRKFLEFCCPVVPSRRPIEF